MPVRGVDTKHVDSRAPQRSDARLALGTDADRGADPQAPQLILARVRMPSRLVHILHRDKSAQPILIVDERQFLDPMRLQKFLGLVEVDSGTRSDHLGGHHVAHLLVEAPLEAQVAIGQNSNQPAV